MLVFTSTMMALLTFLVMISPFSESVLMIGALLMTTAMLSTLMLAKILNAWFALILFLIYITGMLVLFSYMMALSPNTFKANNMKLSIISLVIIMILMINMCNSLSLPVKKTTFEFEVIYMLNQLNIPLYWIMAMILLMALIMAVSMCYKAPAPLRPFL